MLHKRSTSIKKILEKTSLILLFVYFDTGLPANLEQSRYPKPQKSTIWDSVMKRLVELFQITPFDFGLAGRSEKKFWEKGKLPQLDFSPHDHLINVRRLLSLQISEIIGLYLPVIFPLHVDNTHRDIPQKDQPQWKEDIVINLLVNTKALDKTWSCAEHARPMDPQIGNS